MSAAVVVSSTVPARSLVIDGGKSKTAVAIIDGEGTTLATGQGPGLAMIGEPGGREAVARSLRDALDTVGAVDDDFATAVFGLNGVHAPSPDTDAAADVLRSLVSAHRTVVTSDGVLSYVGALGARPGVVVTAGTGVVIIAVDAQDRAHRVDGSGPLLGDRGSGYAIGLAGLRSGMRVLDGLDGSRALADRVRREYGSRDGAVSIIHASPTSTRLIAAFSRDVADVARQGDAEAIALWDAAGVELARGAAAAASRAGLATGYPIAWAGGLFAVGELLVRPFVEQLGRIAPTSPVSPAGGGALAGGAVMARSPGRVMGGVTTWWER